MSKFDRLLMLLNMVRSRPGIGAAELASQAGVSQRTIYRDILTLASQYPIVSDQGYHVLPTAYLRTLNLTRQEYETLRLALSGPAMQRPDLRLLTRSLLAKIDTVVDEKFRQGLRRASSFDPFHSYETSDNRLSTIYNALESAISDLQVITIFPEDGPPKGFNAHPCQLVYRNNSWLLVGYLPSRQEYEIFAVSSIKKTVITNQNFQPREDFQLKDILSSRWGMSGGEEGVVKIRFMGQAAKSVRNQRHHPKAELTHVSAKELIYKISVQGMDEIAGWVLQFGNEAEVLAPRSLRNIVGQKVKSMAELYPD
ncbi:MAG: WYL domain-containing protein [candidate division Zixibacteria bacterium]|nr:WYL domain-containing protein [candidate division Zixibacteria bacterium]